MKASTATLDKLVTWCDNTLRIAEITDFPGAKNGLQVQNSGKVTRIAAAVDANWPVLRAAAELGADLLVVHHGLFWSDFTPITGSNYEKMRLCLDADMAVYSSHLPLDVHPVYGNNALLCRALRLGRTAPFFYEKGEAIGRRASVEISLEELAHRVELAVGGSVHTIAAGPARVGQVGVVTGGAGNQIARAAAEGVDTFITGEANHWVFGAAHDLGVNLILAGHYATETFGVRALAAHLAKKYRVPWDFVDVPSGL